MGSGPMGFGQNLSGWLPLVAMAAVLTGCSWLLAGPYGAVLAASILGGALVFGTNLSGPAAMRLAGARPLPVDSAPMLYRMVEHLAWKAALPAAPQLYRAPGPGLNAFSAGPPDAATIAVSDGLVRLLTLREMQGVLAHEIAHIAAGDTGLMRLAELFRRVTHTVCGVGLAACLLILFSQPGVSIEWWLPWAFALAPTTILLLQLSLSRDREFRADAVAVQLTGDGDALASALIKIDAAIRWNLARLAGRVAGFEPPSWLRTHPAARDRVAKLQSMGRRAPFA